MVRNDSAEKYVFRFLGAVEIEQNGQRIERQLPQKGLALLAYLVANPGVVQARQKLADFLWPDLSEDAARSNLRQVLLGVKRCFGVDDLALFGLTSDRHSICYKSTPHCFIDITEFLMPVPECPSAGSREGCLHCLERVEAVSELYRGDLLDNMAFGGSDEFEDWLQIQRESMQQRALFLFERLSGCFEGQGRYDKALSFAQRFIALAPWSDEGMRRVIRLAAMNGQRGYALSQYQVFCQTLKNELGVLPETKTRKLAQSIQNGGFFPAPLKPLPSSTKPEAAMHNVERRHITICYCQLIPLGNLEPEDEVELLSAPLRRCEDILAGRMGHVVPNKFGSGLLVYFGFPKAQETAALNATRAALALATESIPDIHLSIGIWTGTVLSSPEKDQADIAGRASGCAVGLSHLAADGEIVISEATRDLLEGYFDTTSLGDHRLPGELHPEPCFKVKEKKPNTSVSSPSEAAPLVGRRHELNLIKDFWYSARKGEGRALLLQGDPGIGKSRLMASFIASLHDPSCVVLELNCSFECRESPWMPIIYLLKRLLEKKEAESSLSRLDCLVHALKSCCRERAEDLLPLAAALLSIPGEGERTDRRLPADQQHELILSCLVALLGRLGEERTVCIFVEDLHWADPSTLEVLARLIGNGIPDSIFLLMSARPEFVPPWRSRDVRLLNLNPLSNRDIGQIVLATTPEVPATLLDRIVERADGVPLFAEQLSRLPVDSLRADDLVIPISLQDLLTARLDRLGQDKRLLQLAATIGREFSAHLLAELSLSEEQEVLASLFRLKHEGLVDITTENLWQFRHALIRDAAYMSQARSDRASAHRRIAQLFETELPLVSRNQPEVLAFHWNQAGESDTALNYWIWAGNLAQGLGAHQEAVRHFTAGLDLLMRLQEPSARRAQEWQLQVGIGASAYAIEGYGSSRGAAAYNRAVELSEEEGDLKQSFPALWGLWAGASSHSSWEHSLQRAQRLVQMVKRSRDPILRQQSQFAVGNVQFWRGEFGIARTHLQRAIKSYSPEQHAELIGKYGENAFVTSNSYLSWCLCLLGFPEQALQAGQAAIEEAQRCDHPFSLGYALTFHTALHRMLRQPTSSLELAEQTIALARQHDLPLWQVGATLMKGWAQVMLGRPEGLDEMQWSVDQIESLMGGIVLIFLETQADGLLKAGKAREALTVLDKALRRIDLLDDHHAEAELYRLKGLCLLALGYTDLSPAEDALQTALRISRKKHALLYELRAAKALATLRIRQDRSNDGFMLLSEVCQRFPEGFHLPDLKSSEQLLAELSS